MSFRHYALTLLVALAAAHPATAQPAVAPQSGVLVLRNGHVLEGDVTRAGGLAFIVGTIVEGPHEWTVRPVVELLTAHETDHTATYSTLVGAIWRASEVISPDLAVRAATEAGEPVYELRAGLTWSY